ncbi:MAG: hypothetical protein P8Y28_12935, partial [Gammaproteobacteria bacterium]
RVLQAAGTRYGVIPRLFIIKENPFNVVLPISIPDGWVIVSRQVLDMCYESQKDAMTGWPLCLRMRLHICWMMISGT